MLLNNSPIPRAHELLVLDSATMAAARSKPIRPAVFAQTSSGNQVVRRRAVLDLALDAVRQIPIHSFAVECFLDLAPRVSDSERRRAVIREAFEIAQKIPDQSSDTTRYANILAELAPHLEGPDRKIALRLGLANIEKEKRDSHTDTASYARILSKLASSMSGAKRRMILQQAFEAADSIQYDSVKLTALVEIASRLPAALRQAALRKAIPIFDKLRSSPDDILDLIILPHIAPHLEESRRYDLLRNAAASARERLENNPSNMSFLLTDFALQLPDPEREAILITAFSAMKEIQDEQTRALNLARIIPHLPVAMIAEAQEAVAAISETRSRLFPLASLILRMPKNKRQSALRKAEKLALSVSDDYDRANALVSLLPLTEGPQATRNTSGRTAEVISLEHYRSAAALPSAQNYRTSREITKLLSHTMLYTGGVIGETTTPPQERGSPESRQRPPLSDTGRELTRPVDAERALAIMSAHPNAQALIDALITNPDAMATAAREILKRGDDLGRPAPQGAAHVEAGPRAQREATPHAGVDLKLSSKQVAAVIAAVVSDSTLGRLQDRYDSLRKMNLPAKHLKNVKQARFAAKLSTTFENLQKRRKKLGLEPLPQDPKVTDARRLSSAFYRNARTEPTRSGSRRRRATAATPA
jgi:hypothetical protein